MVKLSSVTNSSQKASDPIAAARSISMLGEGALRELSKLASTCGGPAIELGPYIGGSTCALASSENARVVTVEIGGVNRDHPQLPTEDTVADLETNLTRAGVRSRVDIVVGHFREAPVFEAVRQHLGGLAGLLFVDVTPGTEIAVQQYLELLKPDAFIVIDDYVSDEAAEKAAQVRSFVNAAVEKGYLEEIGVLGWGTWFGRLKGPQAVDGIRNLPVSQPLWPAGGYAWYAHVGHAQLADDASFNTSSLELLEDGRLMGPAHTQHDEIRQAGLGRYSHWRGGLYFSASDNSSPHENGRRYSIRVNAAEWDLRGFTPLPS